MLSENLVVERLAQADGYVCIVELAMSLNISVSQVRQKLKELGDRVEHNDCNEWQIVSSLAPSSSDRLLSPAEKQERDALENTVQQAFYEAGKALKALRDKRLYRETHTSFESYVKDRFDYTRRAADYLISASEVVENLKQEQFVLRTNVLPSKESQCRPLTKLTPQRQREVWCSAVKKAQGKVPSSRIVKEIVRQNRSESTIKTPTTNQEIIYQPGIGIDYVVHLDEETYKLLQTYQDKIGVATKNGAIRRLLKDAIAL